MGLLHPFPAHSLLRSEYPPPLNENPAAGQPEPGSPAALLTAAQEESGLSSLDINGSEFYRILRFRIFPPCLPKICSMSFVAYFRRNM